MSEILKTIITDDDKKILTGDNFSEIRARGADYEITVDELRGVTPETLVRFKEYLKTKDAEKLSQDAKTGFIALIAEVEKNPVTAPAQSPQASSGVIPMISKSSYTSGKDAFAVSKDAKFEGITTKVTVKNSDGKNEIKDVEKDIPALGMTVKRNISILQSKVRTDWIRHLDDTMLGSDFAQDTFKKDYEHLGRVVTQIAADHWPWIGAVDSEKKGGKITNYSKDRASDIIDSIVSQAGNGDKNLKIGKEEIPFPTTQERDNAIKEMLVDMNNSLISEDNSWIGLATVPGVYIEGLILFRVGKLVLTKGWGIKKIGVPTVAFGGELYEKLNRALKGTKESGKSLWKSTQDRITARKAEGAKEKELTPEQLELKKKQTEGMKEVIKEHLFERFGDGRSYEEFVTDIEAGGVASDSKIRDARRELSGLTEKIGKHLPVDISVMDQWEVEMKLREVALDFPMGFWEGKVNSVYRLLLENSAMELALQNKWVKLSERWKMGKYSENVTSTTEKLTNQFDRVKVSLGEGIDPIYVPRAQAKEIEDVIKHVNAQTAQDVIEAEKVLAQEINTLNNEIETLKNDGIPDSEQGVVELERELAEAQRKYDEYKTLFDDTIHKEGAVETAESQVSTKEGALKKAQEAQSLLNEYWEAKKAHDTASSKYVERSGEVMRAKESLKRTITTVENDLRSKIKKMTFTNFDVDITHPDFITQAEVHVADLQGRVLAYNEKLKSATGKIDIVPTFSSVNNGLQTLGKKEQELNTTESTRETSKDKLDTKIQELKDGGLWDASQDVPNITPRDAKGQVVTAESDLELAKREKIKAESVHAKANKLLDGQDGLGKTLKKLDGSLITDADVIAKKTQASNMKKNLSDRAKKVQELSSQETARIDAAKKAGLSEADVARLKPQLDGTHTTDGERVLQDLIDNASTSRTQFDVWKARIDPTYVVEMREGKVEIKDRAGGLKGKFDMSKPQEAAKLFEKFGRR